MNCTVYSVLLLSSAECLMLWVLKQIYTVCAYNTTFLQIVKIIHSIGCVEDNSEDDTKFYDGRGLTSFT